jgi:hypothetical protein
VLFSYLPPSSDRVPATPEEYEFDSLDENVVDQALTPLFDNAPKESITNGNKRGKKDKSNQKGKRAMKNMFNKRGHETTSASSSSSTTSLFDGRQNRTNNNPNMILRGVHTRFGTSANTLSDDSSSVVPLSPSESVVLPKSKKAGILTSMRKTIKKAVTGGDILLPPHPLPLPLPLNPLPLILRHEG